MKLFTVIIFELFGLAFLTISFTGAEFYFKYIMSRPFFGGMSRGKVKALTALVGFIMVLYGIAALVGWI